MRRVYLESPYKGKNWENTEENLRFGRLCMRDCLVNRDEAPFPSHLLYTQPEVLDDKIPAERELGGFKAGPAFKEVCDLSAFYINRGMSSGMYRGVKISIDINQNFEYRILPDYPFLFPRPAICTITGASGSGKSTIVKKILHDLRPGVRLVTSFTSRTRRPQDLPGEYRYEFSEESFAKKRKSFLWVVGAHGNVYGTHKRSIAAALKPSAACPRLMILAPDAVSILQKHLRDQIAYGHEDRIISFYILSPGEDELRHRLHARGDDEVSVKRRLAECREWDEMALKSDIPYIFIRNNELVSGAERAAKQMTLFF